jgi:hypothetical protein
MSAPPGLGVVAPALRERVRAAGARIAWAPAAPLPGRPRNRRGRMAAFREDRARVEEWGSPTRGGLTVDSGPLGALVLLLAIEERGPPTRLGGLRAGGDPAFPDGALVARWGAGPVPEDSRPTLEDVAGLARFALD